MSHLSYRTSPSCLSTRTPAPPGRAQAAKSKFKPDNYYSLVSLDAYAL
jgi:hypothetical protein